MGLNPSDRWVGGYVEYEWGKLRPLLNAYGVDLEGKRALEFGCNYGGSSIVLAFLGAEVRGVDVSSAAISLARCNADQYGRSDINLQHVRDSRYLPFPGHHFDFVSCNSVLEYVSPPLLPGVVRELHRVMKPGARLLITGTSNRLSLREIHSGKWLANYLPIWLDRFRATPRQRGIGPFRLRRLVAPLFYDEDAETAGKMW